MVSFLFIECKFVKAKPLEKYYTYSTYRNKMLLNIS